MNRGAGGRPWLRPGGAEPSLHRALLLGLLLPLLALIPLVALLIHSLVLRPALDALDRALTDTAVALAQIVEVHEGQASLPLSEQTARALRADILDDIYFTVLGPDGRLLGGMAELQALAPRVEAGAWHFFDAEAFGLAMRLAAHGQSCGPRPGQVCVILVAETLRKRRAAEQAALWAALLGALALALPLAALALRAVRRGLAPLQQAADEVEALGPQRLDPVAAHDVPAEVIGFVHALNRLLERLDKAATAQRAFVADAAHQLRTPLAVMQVEAGEALARPHPPEMRPSLERLHAAAERGARLAQQLLSLARAEGEAMDPARLQQQAQPLDLARLATSAAQQWWPRAEAAGLDLGFDLQPAWVRGQPVLLEELMGNLLHNAIEHAGPGTRVTLTTREDADGSAVIRVEDDGPGLAEAEEERVWLRFHRGPQAAGAGSGLGLAIVADIARLHGGTVRLGAVDPAVPAGSKGRGLRVEIQLPQAVG